MPARLVCSSHTISGVMPGGPVAARHPFRARVEACARAGFDGMCLHIRDYAECRAAGWTDAELRGVLDEGGITHVGLEFLTGWDHGIAPLEDTAWAAAEALGARYLNVGASTAPPARAAFEALCARAAAHGLPIALEIVPWSGVADLPTALDLIQNIDTAGLVIDCWHVFRGGIPLDDLASLPPHRILGIQINDAAAPTGPLPKDTLNRRLPGQGDFDLAGFLRALRQTGTDCPVSVEVISPDLAAMDVNVAASITAKAALATISRAL